MSAIVVIGSTNTDMTIHCDSLPSMGEIVAGTDFQVAPGGKGANEAIAASRLGGAVTLITKTGNDLFGRQAKQMFADEGIRTDYIFADPNNPSGVALIMADTNGDKYVAVAQGGIKTLSYQDIDRARSAILQAKVLLIELETPIDVAIYAAKIAKENGAIVIINPSPRQNLPAELFCLTDIIIPNRYEASKLSGIKISNLDDAKKAAEVIATMGVNTVLITLGSKGSILYRNGETNFFEAIETLTKDPSGAGDVFCSALCVALSEGCDLTDGIQLATAAGSIQASRLGMVEAIPYRHEVEALISTISK